MGAKIYRIALLMLLFSLPAAQGCGKKGPPLPPVDEKGVSAPPPAEAQPEEKAPEEPAAPAPEAQPPKAPY